MYSNDTVYGTTKQSKFFKAGTVRKYAPSCSLLEELGFTLTAIEKISVHTNELRNNIVLEGGIFRNETHGS